MTALASFSTTSVRVPKMAELVAEHVRRRIVRGELDEGDALPPESALMDEFGVSRPTLREAFRVLESEGLITVRRGARGGAWVQLPTSAVAARYAGLVLQHRGATLADVLDARVIVEAPAAAMVAARHDRAEAGAELRRWLDVHADDPQQAPLWFDGFNRLLVQLTGNLTLILVTTMIEAIADAATASYTKVPHADDAHLGAKAHRTRLELIGLVEQGDEPGATALWREHLTQAGTVLRGTSGRSLVDVIS